jgi:dihydrofolate reductase
MPSTVLSGGMVDEVTILKKEQDGDIVVHGSAHLAQSLIENDIVDELPSAMVGDGVAIQIYTGGSQTGQSMNG